MSLSLVHSRALLGLQARPVMVEIHLANGLPNFTLVGLAETEVKEARERVRAAIQNSGLEFPVNKRITVNLAPADLPKDSGRFDLPIALGILAASGQIDAAKLSGYEFAGELSLGGELRPVRGALAMSLAIGQTLPAGHAGARPQLVLPQGSAEEAALVPDVHIYRARHLLDVVRQFLPVGDLLPYVESVLSVYNTLGRRDNKYKARIKITVHETGRDEIARMIEARFAEVRPLFGGADQALLADIRAAFAQPALQSRSLADYDAAYQTNPAFRAWADTNLSEHRKGDHAIVTISVKAHGQTPGDATSDQMRVIADLSETYGYSELRISHEQNVILPHVAKADLPAVHAALAKVGLATANVGLLSDMIACPGMDYCALATARSIPVAQEIALHFEALKLEHDIGQLKIKISGCINACGHHHVGHIGILGLDRAGVENYQITLGGDATETAAIGEKTGPGFAYDEIVPAIERILRAYLGLRLHAEETFLDAYRRVGMDPFKRALYGDEGHQDAA
jgi:dissimilatory sulfite reductase (desulfoviridin) alpha/beta subunit